MIEIVQDFSSTYEEKSVCVNFQCHSFKAIMHGYTFNSSKRHYVWLLVNIVVRPWVFHQRTLRRDTKEVIAIIPPSSFTCFVSGIVMPIERVVIIYCYPCFPIKYQIKDFFINVICNVCNVLINKVKFSNNFASKTHGCILFHVKKEIDIYMQMHLARCIEYCNINMGEKIG